MKEHENPEVERIIIGVAKAIKETLNSNNSRANMIYHLTLEAKRAIENAYATGVIEILDLDRENKVATVRKPKGDK